MSVNPISLSYEMIDEISSYFKDVIPCSRSPKCKAQYIPDVLSEGYFSG